MLSPGKMCVHYIGEMVSRLKKGCSVHQGIMIHVGDIISTLGDIMIHVGSKLLKAFDFY